MKEIDDFALTNEALHQIRGGGQNANASRHFTFSGANAVEDAKLVSQQTQQNCGCACGCSDGGGAGGGAGS